MERVRTTLSSGGSRNAMGVAVALVTFIQEPETRARETERASPMKLKRGGASTMEPEQEEGDGVRCGSRSASPAPEQEEGTGALLVVEVCSGHGGRRRRRGLHRLCQSPSGTSVQSAITGRRVTDAAPTNQALISYSCPCALANRHQE